MSVEPQRPPQDVVLVGGHTAPGSELPTEQWRRVELLCEAYGDVDPVDVVGAAVGRLEDLIAYSSAEAAAGDAALQHTIDLGHVALYEGDVQCVRALWEA